MKININLLATLVFCLLLHTAQAQQIKRLAVGDQMPELTFSNSHTGGPNKVQLSDFKGKGILIDFWASWCSPCVAAMGFLDSLQVKFKDQLQVISVTREDNKVIKEVYGRLFPNRAPSFLTLIGDTVLEKYFPHQTIPHCVWIDKNGKVTAITDNAAVTFKNIQDMIAGNVVQVKNKPPKIKLDTHKPPYASKQLNLTDEFLYHSLITRYREDLQINYARGAKDNFIACTNSSIIRLYQTAFGKFNLSWLDMNRVICEGFTTFADSASIGLFKSRPLINEFIANMKSYAFTYEMAVADTVYSRNEIFEIMQQDLNRFFSIYGLTARTEKRNHKVLALVAIDGKNHKSFKGTDSIAEKYADPTLLKVVNEPMAYFLSQLEPYLGDIPLKNETAYNGKVNISLIVEKDNLPSINNALASYGLKLIEKEELWDMVIITKTKGKRSLM